MNKKIKPLKEKDEIEDLVNCIKKKLYLKEDVLSALALAKKKMEDFCNKNNIDDCGGMEKAIEILDECFQIQDEKEQDK